MSLLKKILKLRNAIFLLFAIILFLATRNFLFKPGVILYGEFLGVYDYLPYLKEFTQGWSSYTTLGHSNIGYPTIYGLNPTFYIVPPGIQLPWIFCNYILQLLFGSFGMQIQILSGILIPFFGMYVFARYWFRNVLQTNQTYMAFISGLLYSMNALIGDRIFAGHLKICYGIGLLPILFLFTIRAYESETKKDRILFILLAGLTFGIEFWIMAHALYLYVFLVGLYFFFFILPSTRYGLYAVCSTFFIIAIGLGLNIHIWLPPKFITETYPALLDMYYNLSEVYSSSRFTTLDKVLTITSGIESMAIKHIFYNNTMWLRFFLPLCGLIGFLLSRQRKKVCFIFTVTILGIVLSMGINPPFEKIYTYLYQHFFLFKPFRDVSKFIILYVFGLSLLVPYCFLWMKKYFFIGIIIFTVYILTVNPMFVSGDFEKTIVPFTIPEKYHTLKSFLEKKAGDYRATFYPNTFYVGNLAWFPKQTNPSPYYTLYQSVFPLNTDLAMSNRTQTDNTSRYLDFLEQHIYESWAMQRLANEHVRFIIVDHDLPDIKTTLIFLNANSSLKKISGMEGFTIFEIIPNKPTLTKIKTSVYTAGDKTILAKIPAEIGIIDLQTNPAQRIKHQYSDAIILHNTTITDVFLDSLTDYHISFMPTVRFTIDGSSTFILGGELLRPLYMKGISFSNPEAMFITTKGSISHKISLKKNTYRLFAKVYQATDQSHIFSIKVNDKIITKPIPADDIENVRWIDMGKQEITENPVITVTNKEPKPLVIDSILMIPDNAYSTAKKTFTNTLKGMHMYQSTSLPDLNTIRSKPITKLAQSYSPYWNICNEKPFTIDYYATGVACETKPHTPVYEGNRFYQITIAIAAAGYIVCLSLITYGMWKRKK